MSSDSSATRSSGAQPRVTAWGPDSVPDIPPPPMGHVLTLARAKLEKRRMLGGRLVKVGFVLIVLMVFFLLIEVATFARLSGPESTLTSDRRAAMAVLGDFVTLLVPAHLALAAGVWIIGARIQSGSKLSPIIAIAFGAAAIAACAIPIVQLLQGSFYLLALPVDAGYVHLVVIPFLPLLAAALLVLVGGVAARHRPVKPYKIGRVSRPRKSKA